jgi:hypothetical protein
VILGGVAVLARDDGSTTTVNPANPGTEEPGVAVEAQTTALRKAMEAVMTWSQAVGEGDSERAWSLMGPLSQKYLIDSGAWDDMKVALGEGSFGKWHPGGMPTSLEGRPAGEGLDVSGENQAGNKIRAAFLPGTEDAAVVTLSGVFELEGNREEVLDAFPLTRDGNGPWRIEPFAFGPGETTAEFVRPGPAEDGGLEDAERGFTLEVHGTDADTVAVQVWAEEPDQVTVNARGFRAMETAGNDRWSAPFSKDLPPGSLQFVVVTRGPGFITTHPVDIFVKDGEPTACPNIGFTPNSDDVASEITISGGECAEAERVVRHVHEEMKHNFFDGPRYFTALGYECTVRTVSEGLESGLYRCTDGATLVSWRKT